MVRPCGRRWPSKAAVAAAALERLALQTVDLPESGTLRGDLHALLTSAITVFTQGHGRFVPRLIRESGHHPEIADLLHTVIHTRRLAYRRVLGRAIARHELDPDVDQDLLIDLLIGPIWTRLLITHDPIHQAARRRHRRRPHPRLPRPTDGRGRAQAARRAAAHPLGVAVPVLPSRARRMRIREFGALLRVVRRDTGACAPGTGARAARSDAAQPAAGARHYVDMPRFRAEVVFYFDADDTRTVPRRLQQLNAAAAAVGFDFHGVKATEGSEPEPAEHGWTGYAPMPEPPA